MKRMLSAHNVTELWNYCFSPNNAYTNMHVDADVLSGVYHAEEFNIPLANKGKFLFGLMYRYLVLKFGAKEFVSSCMEIANGKQKRDLIILIGKQRTSWMQQREFLGDVNHGDWGFRKLVELVGITGELWDDEKVRTSFKNVTFLDNGDVLWGVDDASETVFR